MLLHTVYFFSSISVQFHFKVVKLIIVSLTLHTVWAKKLEQFDISHKSLFLQLQVICELMGIIFPLIWPITTIGVSVRITS